MIELAAHVPDSDAGASVARPTETLVTVRPKPEKRKNARERAKEKFAKAGGADDVSPELTAEAKRKAAKVEAKAKTKAARAERKEKAKKARSGH